MRTQQLFSTVKPVSLLAAAAGTLFLSATAGAPAARAQAALPFLATYTGIANTTGPDANGVLFVTSTLNDPLASFGLTEALFTQTVNVFANPNVLIGTSIFQSLNGAGPDKLFTAYSGTGTPFDPPNGVLVTNFSGVFNFSGGTGRFAGAGGGGTFVGQASLTNAVSVTFRGNVTTIPEPATGALLATGLLPLAGLVARRRRS